MATEPLVIPPFPVPQLSSILKSSGMQWKNSIPYFQCVSASQVQQCTAPTLETVRVKRVVGESFANEANMQKYNSAQEKEPPILLLSTLLALGIALSFRGFLLTYADQLGIASILDGGHRGHKDFLGCDAVIH